MFIWQGRNDCFFCFFEFATITQTLGISVLIDKKKSLDMMVHFVQKNLSLAHFVSSILVVNKARTTKYEPIILSLIVGCNKFLFHLLNIICISQTINTRFFVDTFDRFNTLKHVFMVQFQCFSRNELTLASLSIFF